jgi:hypothetical protein
MKERAIYLDRKTCYPIVYTRTSQEGLSPMAQVFRVGLRASCACLSCRLRIQYMEAATSPRLTHVQCFQTYTEIKDPRLKHPNDEIKIYQIS